MTSVFRSIRIHAHWYVIATLLLCHTRGVEAKQIDGDRLLDPNRLVEVRIELPPDDWNQLCRQSRNPATAFNGLPNENPYTYVKADVWIDGVKIESVGIRKKGFFGSADFQRPSLKIKFDEYVAQDPVKGLSRLTLNNNKQDRSQVSQFLVYRLFRKAGNPAPRSNWAHVIVNGESLGIYSNVESIKKPFLSRNFEDKTGNLYEGTLTDFYPKSLVSIEVKTNESENDLSDIKQLADLLAADGELDLDELGKLIDLDSFFRHWALESLTGFWDGYSSNQNNYFLYFDPKTGGRGHFIPWGADAAFTHGGPFAGGPFGSGNRATTVIYAQGILTHRLYHSSGVPQRYRETMKRLLEDVWDEDTMLAEMDRVEKLVSPHLHTVQSGTRQALNEIREFIRGRRDAVEQALTDWRPNVPREPRKPGYIVDVGKANGTFSTVFGDSGSNQATDRQSEITMELDGKPLELERVAVRAQMFQFPGFGGFGGPPGGGAFGGGPPGGGFPGPPGRARGAPATVPTPPIPVSLVFMGERAGGQPVTMSLIIDRDKFEAPADDGLPVTGSFQEGRGAGFGFGGFGAGPSRSVVGEIRLTKSGSKSGDEVAGSIDLRIVETHGGLFQQGPPASGFPPPRRRNSPQALRQSQPLTLQRAFDADRDGTISAAEIQRAATALKRLDRNGDGKLSGDEFQIPSRGGAGTGTSPAIRQRPESDDDTDPDSASGKPVPNAATIRPF